VVIESNLLVTFRLNIDCDFTLIYLLFR